MASVAIMVVLAAMVAYVLQRRPSKWTKVADVLILSGLIIPPAVVPTVWVLQELSLFKTLQGMILIEVAFGLSFSILLFRAFIATIPRELDEAATIDGARPLRVFFSVIFPLLRVSDDHRDRRPVGHRLQRLRQPALLPARRRERHRPAHALQLPEPVRHLHTTCSSPTSC